VSNWKGTDEDEQSMSEDIKAGVVGLGKMGVAHLAILNAIDGVAVVAVAEKQRLVRKALGSVLPGVNLYSDYERMLGSEDLQAVFITAPTALHVRVAQDCLERGLDIFVEKPLGLSGAEARHLAPLAAGNDAVAMVGYCKHFVETFREAKCLLEQESLGRPLYFSSHMYVSQLFTVGSGWRYKKESSGGGVLNILATHLVDLLLWYFGDVSKVSCFTRSHYSAEVEDFVHAYLDFEEGPSGSLDASWSVRGYRLPEIKIEVQCENGSLTVTEDYLKYNLDTDGSSRTLYKQDLFEPVEVYVGGAEYTREDRHFIDCVKSRRTPETDIACGYGVQAVTDAMYASAEAARLVEVVPL
jgi:predicted dehydrogenase